jgi:HlyD family secretion protein
MEQPNYLLEPRSEEVQELLTRVPPWALRWGIVVLFTILCLVFLGAWLIHYPDVVTASFRLASPNAPKAVLARADGKLVRLFAREGDVVKAGQVLAYLESTANHAEVLRLSGRVSQVQQMALRGDWEACSRLDLAQYAQLGELQEPFQRVVQTHEQLRAGLPGGFYQQKKTLLAQELGHLQALSVNLAAKQQIHKRDLALADEDLAVQQRLAEQKVIAPLELKREESKNLVRQLPYQQTESERLNNLIAQRGKQQQMLEIDKQVQEGRTAFSQALRALQSAIGAWKARYLVTAPVGGRVYFPAVRQENQFIASNQELLYVAPQHAAYVGELWIPQHNFGKVRTGQRVLVKFAGYPYAEFGAVHGKITAISEVPLNDSVFPAQVTLPADLVTTYGKRLTYKTGMSASAEVITEDRRLLEKLFYQLRSLTGERP